MRMGSDLMQYRLYALVAAGMLSACASQGTPGSSTTSQYVPPQIDYHQHKSKVEHVLHSFKGVKDGSLPEPELVAVGTTLYGTTFEGGDPSCPYAFYGSVGCGTVFKIDTSGSGYAVLHRFGKTANGGMFPTLGVINKDSMLFGTAFFGGGDGSKCDPAFNGCGTLYQIDPTGKGFNVLHDFVGGDDGAGPFANVVSGGKNMLYGATNGGGSGGCASEGGCGVVYAFDLTTGTESTVYPFEGGADGIDPIGLIDVKSTLYGVTYFGGSTSGCPSGSSFSGCGTIFKIDLSSGKESVLYRFKGGKDGAFPSNVVNIGGDLYGTTDEGGGSACAGSGFSGCGTIFKVNETTGAEKVLYRFKGDPDGALPTQILAKIKGTLYGTTFEGGSGCAYPGCGTIYKIDTSGKDYDVVYSFRGGTDGAYPDDGVISVSGALYGTTSEGGGKGCNGFGCGTVFEATP
jgi:uncharacterized repeat protein (TIGR03803 family)